MGSTVAEKQSRCARSKCLVSASPMALPRSNSFGESSLSTSYQSSLKSTALLWQSLGTGSRMPRSSQTPRASSPVEFVAWQNSINQICSLSLLGHHVNCSPLQLLTSQVCTTCFRGTLVRITQVGHVLGQPSFWFWENVPVQEEWLRQAEAAPTRQAIFLNAAFPWHHRRNRLWILPWDLVGDAAKWFRRKSCGRWELWVSLSSRRFFRSSLIPPRLRG